MSPHIAQDLTGGLMTSQSEAGNTRSRHLAYCLHQHDRVLPWFVTVILPFQDTLAQGRNLTDSLRLSCFIKPLASKSSPCCFSPKWLYHEISLIPKKPLHWNTCFKPIWNPQGDWTLRLLPQGAVGTLCGKPVLRAGVDSGSAARTPAGLFRSVCLK